MCPHFGAMSSRTVLVYYSPGGRPAPDVLRIFADEERLLVMEVAGPRDVIDCVNRMMPAGIFLDSVRSEESVALCHALKQDAFSGIVPIVMLAPAVREDVVLAGLEAGADEVITEDMPAREQLLRLRMMLHRAERDVSVHPTTRLPGTVQIERDIGDRMRRSEIFAVCY